MAKIKANGIQFNYEISGRKGAPWITFSNSLGTNIHMWDEQAELLAKDWCILRYDQRGHGGTEVSPGPYNFEQLTADMIALWDALGIRQSVFCGLSMGGITGIGLVLNHADRVRAFIGADCRCDSPPGFREAWDERIAQAKEFGMEGMTDRTANRWFTEKFVRENPAVIDKVKQMIRTTPQAGFIACCQALQNIEYRARLPQITVPTMYCCGESDGAANPDYMRPMHETTPGSQFEVIENAGHISNMENPPRFNAIMTGFLNGL